MARQAGDQPARAIEIAAQLRTAELVREGDDVIDAACIFFRRPARDAFGGAPHAAHRAQNPDFVARADFAVCPAIAQERTRQRALPGDLAHVRCRGCQVLVLVRAAEQRFQVL
jgi:hypothetical protein